MPAVVSINQEKSGVAVNHWLCHTSDAGCSLGSIKLSPSARALRQ